MSTPRYRVTGTLPPALVPHPLGGSYIVSGTIERLQTGGNDLPLNYRFPEGTTLRDFEFLDSTEARLAYSGGYVQPFPPRWDHPETTHTLVMASNGIDQYVVRRDPIGHVDCNCKGFTYNKKCKHVMQVSRQEAADCPKQWSSAISKTAPSRRSGWPSFVT